MLSVVIIDIALCTTTASHPCSSHFDSTLPPAVAFTDRLTDPVGRWHGGGSVELSVTPHIQELPPEANPEGYTLILTRGLILDNRFDSTAVFLVLPIAFYRRYAGAGDACKL